LRLKKHHLFDRSPYVFTDCSKQQKAVNEEVEKLHPNRETATFFDNVVLPILKVWRKFDHLRVIEDPWKQLIECFEYEMMLQPCIENDVWQFAFVKMVNDLNFDSAGAKYTVQSPDHFVTSPFDFNNGITSSLIIIEEGFCGQSSMISSSVE